MSGPSQLRLGMGGFEGATQLLLRRIDQLENKIDQFMSEIPHILAGELLKEQFGKEKGRWDTEWGNTVAANVEKSQLKIQRPGNQMESKDSYDLKHLKLQLSQFQEGDDPANREEGMLVEYEGPPIYDELSECEEDNLQVAYERPPLFDEEAGEGTGQGRGANSVKEASNSAAEDLISSRLLLTTVVQKVFDKIPERSFSTEQLVKMISFQAASISIDATKWMDVEYENIYLKAHRSLTCIDTFRGCCGIIQALQNRIWNPGTAAFQQLMKQQRENYSRCSQLYAKHGIGACAKKKGDYVGPAAAEKRAVLDQNNIQGVKDWLVPLSILTKTLTTELLQLNAFLWNGAATTTLQRLKETIVEMGNKKWKAEHRIDFEFLGGVKLSGNREKGEPHIQRREEKRMGARGREQHEVLVVFYSIFFLEPVNLRTSKVITTTPYLALTDIPKPFNSELDVSNIGLRAELHECKVVYYSTVADLKGQSLSRYRREVKALEVSVEHRPLYAALVLFLIRTYHRALMYLQRQKITNPLQRRWESKLSYTYITCTKMEKVIVVSLSRSSETEQGTNLAVSAWSQQLLESYGSYEMVPVIVLALQMSKMDKNEYKLHQGLLKDRGKWGVRLKLCMKQEGNLFRQLLEVLHVPEFGHSWETSVRI